MNIVVVGIGKMGLQIAKKLHESGMDVSGIDPSAEARELAIQVGIRAYGDLREIPDDMLSAESIVWLMLPAGIVDVELKRWLTKAPRGALFVDGGNSRFTLSNERAKATQQSGHDFLDVGTSGGVWGYKNGFSLMAGGGKEAFERIEPVLKVLSAPGGGFVHVGGNGAGHYAKMIHNAIEYGVMQALAEGYQMLAEGPYDIDVSQVGAVWQRQSVIRSWLNELVVDIVSRDHQLSGIEGVVAESGEARWAVETAQELGIKMPATQTALDVRYASQKGDVSYATKLLAAMRHAFGGHEVNL